MNAEVLIIGAGPAGTAAAIHLGQLGIANVVLVDRLDFPRDKTCGSGVSPKGIATLKSLGVWHEVEPVAYPIRGLRVVTSGDREMYVSGGDVNAAVICQRRVLDHILLERARALGVTFLPNFVARELLEANGRIAGVVARDGREIRARYTIIADGAHSKFIVERGPKKLIHAIMGWWDRVPFRAHHVEMVFDQMVLPYYGWLFPETATRVNIGICYGDDAHEKNARELFGEFLAKHYARRLEGAQQVGDWKGHPISYSYTIDQLHSPGRLVVGEAGRMTHPATAEGIYQGMRSGMLAADAIAEISRGAGEADAFARFQRNCRRTFLRSFWGAALIKRAVSSPVPDWMVMTAKPLFKRFAEGLAS
ncbi:MAG TPA: NAD(P)/FAD-dependent oxidoreductase [Kofleriaceae bacterium]|jgi:geranylgeranyl reductase family protein